MRQLWLLAVALLCGLAGAQVATPAPAATPPDQPTATAPAQPIPFSHKQHVQTAKLGCNDCHKPSRSGAALLIPQAATCMQCHTAIAADKPAIQKLADSAKSGDPIPWVRVYQVPSFVQFSNKVHTAANNTCTECHGDVGNVDAVARVTDISMGGCLNCHKQKNAQTACNTCHELQSRLGPMPADHNARMLLASLRRADAHTLRAYLQPLAAPAAAAAYFATP